MNTKILIPLLGGCRGPVGEPVPSTAVLDWRVWPWRFIEIGLTAVGVPGDEAVLDPPRQCTFTNSETGGEFCFREHPLISQPVVA